MGIVELESKAAEKERRILPRGQGVDSRYKMKPIAAITLVVIVAFGQGLFASQATAQPQTNRFTPTHRRATPRVARPDVASKDVHFFSEGIQCYGRIYTPNGFSSEGRSPAVVLAPGWGKTAGSLANHAEQFASRGLVAMTIDYRGWGKSGGFLQTVDFVKTDDRLRFSELTARVIIRRKRLIPRHQVLDIRNALYYLQGEPGIDRSRIGVWGIEMSGGHAITIAATDSRVKAVVAQAPVIAGKGKPKQASEPKGALLKAKLKRARIGDAPATSGVAKNDIESRLALAEYHPFWLLDQIPQTTAVLFVVAENETNLNNQADSIAASRLLKGPTNVVRVPGLGRYTLASGQAFEAAVGAAVEWFLKYL